MNGSANNANSGRQYLFSLSKVGKTWQVKQKRKYNRSVFSNYLNIALNWYWFVLYKIHNQIIAKVFQLSIGDRHNERKIGSIYHLYWMCHWKEFFRLPLKSTVRALIFTALLCESLTVVQFFTLNLKHLTNRTRLSQSKITDILL